MNWQKLLLVFGLLLTIINPTMAQWPLTITSTERIYEPAITYDQSQVFVAVADSFSRNYGDYNTFRLYCLENGQINWSMVDSNQGMIENIQLAPDHSGGILALTFWWANSMGAMDLRLERINQQGVAWSMLIDSNLFVFDTHVLLISGDAALIVWRNGEGTWGRLINVLNGEFQTGPLLITSEHVASEVTLASNRPSFYIASYRWQIGSSLTEISDVGNVRQWILPDSCYAMKVSASAQGVFVGAMTRNFETKLWQLSQDSSGIIERIAVPAFFDYSFDLDILNNQLLISYQHGSDPDLSYRFYDPASGNMSDEQNLCNWPGYQIYLHTVIAESAAVMIWQNASDGGLYLQQLINYQPRWTEPRFLGYAGVGGGNTYFAVAAGGDFGFVAWADSNLLYVQPGNEFITSSSDPFDPLPSMLVLKAAYPNPFNPITTIVFALDRQQKIRLAVYDITGREVAALADQWFPTGEQRFTFDASSLPSGSYFARLQSENLNRTVKLVLLK